MLESPLQFTPSPRSSCPSSPDHPTTTAALMRKHLIVPASTAGSSGSSGSTTSGSTTSGSKRSSGTYSIDCNASLWRRLSSKLTHTTATTTATTTLEANIEQVHNHNKSEMNTKAATTTATTAATAEVVTEDVWRIAASTTRMQDLVRKIAFSVLTVV